MEVTPGHVPTATNHLTDSSEAYCTVFRETPDIEKEVLFWRISMPLELRPYIEHMFIQNFCGVFIVLSETK